MSQKNKICTIPDDVIKKIHDDIEGNGVRIYRVCDVPDSFINKHLIHPEVLKKSTSVVAAVSGCVGDERNYIFLTTVRVDKNNEFYETDLDPIVMVSDLESNSPSPSGVIHFHGNFNGRTESTDIPVEPYYNPVKELQNEVNGSVITFEEAPDRFTNAMHYMANVYRKKIE